VSNHAQEADFVVPKTERGYHPLCGVRIVTGDALTAIEYRTILANGMQS
jgi:hypothetical protein